MSLTILGPERPDGVLPSVLSRRNLRGPLALVSAGWRYDEERDELLRAALPNPIVNLRLYQRFRSIENEAPELTAGWTAKQEALRRVKDRYRLRFHNALGATVALYDENKDPSCLWFAQSVRHLREADELYLSEAKRLHDSFVQQFRPTEHPLVARVRSEILAELEGCEGVLIAGGHVGVLRNRLSFFNLAIELVRRPLFAWSGGAMVLTERVLLYHDHTAHGPGTAEVLDHGFGLLQNVVFLPHAKERLNLADTTGLAVLAHRMAPRALIALQNGAVYEDGHYTGTPGAAFRINLDGSLYAAGT
jgi:hypothetical protein